MSVTLIRVIAGVLAVVVLFVIVWRRKRKSVE
jgi:LPXTG-motif cell wall-anchored protein